MGNISSENLEEKQTHYLSAPNINHYDEEELRLNVWFLASEINMLHDQVIFVMYIKDSRITKEVFRSSPFTPLKKYKIQDFDLYFNFSRPGTAKFCLYNYVNTNLHPDTVDLLKQEFIGSFEISLYDLIMNHQEKKVYSLRNQSEKPIYSFTCEIQQLSKLIYLDLEIEVSEILLEYANTPLFCCITRRDKNRLLYKSFGNTICLKGKQALFPKIQVPFTSLCGNLDNYPFIIQLLGMNGKNVYEIGECELSYLILKQNDINLIRNKKGSIICNIRCTTYNKIESHFTLSTAFSHNYKIQFMFSNCITPNSSHSDPLLKIFEMLVNFNNVINNQIHIVNSTFSVPVLPGNEKQEFKKYCLLSGGGESPLTHLLDNIISICDQFKTSNVYTIFFIFIDYTFPDVNKCISDCIKLLERPIFIYFIGYNLKYLAHLEGHPRGFGIFTSGSFVPESSLKIENLSSSSSPRIVSKNILQNVSRHFIEYYSRYGKQIDSTFSNTFTFKLLAPFVNPRSSKASNSFLRSVM